MKPFLLVSDNQYITTKLLIYLYSFLSPLSSLNRQEPNSTYLGITNLVLIYLFHLVSTNKKK